MDRICNILVPILVAILIFIMTYSTYLQQEKFNLLKERVVILETHNEYILKIIGVQKEDEN